MSGGFDEDRIIFSIMYVNCGQLVDLHTYKWVFTSVLQFCRPAALEYTLTLTSWVTSSRVIWLSPWSSWVRVLTDSRRIKETMSSSEICALKQSHQTSNSSLPYLMMLAAAFLSWVNNSGSCITSSRKAITFVFSSLLVSKSWRGTHNTHKVKNTGTLKALRTIFLQLLIGHEYFRMSILHCEKWPYYF